MKTFINKIKKAIRETFYSFEYTSISEQITQTKKEICESQEACKRLIERHEAFCIYVDADHQYTEEERSKAYTRYCELKL